MPSAKPRIFYVDDNEVSRLVLTLLFGQEGYEVTAISASQAMLFIIPNERFSLYILGTLPPGINGAAFCQKIREFEKRAPIVIYSDATPESNPEAACANGANAFVAKPFIDELIDTVKAKLRL